jgi:RNA polymerase sporulation-specific sigma factor
MTDKELIEKLRAGDQSYMDRLFEKYRPYVRMRANALFLVGGDAEDLNQEGMIGLFKAIRDYDLEQEVPFSAFAKLCINRQMYTAIEASSRKKHAPLNTYVSLEASEESLGSAQSPESMYIETEEEARLAEHFNRVLSSYERKVLRLYLQGRRYTEIAEELGKKPKSVDNAVQRIRAKIAAEISANKE